jgi:MFS family permease
MPPFRRSLPVTLTSFINKSGQIGLSIIPILLVERQFSNDQSAWIMGSIKTAGLAGILLGGWSCDRWGLRATLLLSFLVSGLGMALLPFSQSALLLAVLGCVAQVGASLYYASARLLITQLVPLHERREAIAWQRTANNLAQIISFSLGALLGHLGPKLLILFDALTSFVAAGVGSKLLPPTTASAEKTPSADPPTGVQLAPEETTRSGKRAFYQCALIIASFAFLFELYSVGAAARCKILFGGEGLAVFSKLMVINTIFCAAFSVVAAKYLTRAALTLPAGLALMITGILLTFGGEPTPATFYVGSFITTLGEIVFHSVAGLVLIHFTPPGSRQGTTYSSGILVQFGGRIAGGALAFPMLVGSDHPLTWVAIASIPILTLSLASRPLLKQVE